MPDIFLSYSRENQAAARRFAEGFGRAGFTVWWDQALNPGEAYDKVTEKALEDARAVIVLWSRHSVDSRWVRAEATQANALGTLVPVMIEPCKRPIMFELTHTADLSRWDGSDRDETWQAFLAGVKRFTGNHASTLPAPAAARLGIRKPGIAAVAVAALLIAAMAVWWWLAGREAGRSAQVAAADPVAVTTPSAGPITLAVLPFADLSQAHDQEYFSDGLTEELLNQLAQMKGLRVTARTSSFSFKGRNEDVRVIGQQLGVAHLLEGSVRKDGRQLRITAQLVNSQDGAHAWSKTYDRELSDVFRLQEEVAKDVARALSVKLDVGDLPRIEGGTTNVEAYDKYLHARDLYQQGGAEPSRESAQLLREVVALDPSFARAWLLLSLAAAESTIGMNISDAAGLRKESAAASARVLELAPDAWWSRSQRAYQFVAGRRWAEAEAALAADPGPGANHEINGARLAFLNAVGRMDQLVEVLEQAKLVDPLSFTLSADLQIALDSALEPARAQAEYQRSLALKGTRQRTHVYALMRELAREGSTPESIGTRFRTLLDEEALRMPLTHSLAVSYRDPRKAREEIRLAVQDTGNQDRVRMAVVAMYADRFQDLDSAFAALRKEVVDFGTVNTIWLPYSSRLRADARFKQLVRDTGLADYFHASGRWNDFCGPLGEQDFECH